MIQKPSTEGKQLPHVSKFRISHGGKSSGRFLQVSGWSPHGWWSVVVVQIVVVVPVVVVVVEVVVVMVRLVVTVVTVLRHCLGISAGTSFANS